MTGAKSTSTYGQVIYSRFTGNLTTDRSVLTKTVSVHIVPPFCNLHSTNSSQLTVHF